MLGSIGCHEPKPAKRTRVFVGIFDLPAFGTTFGNFDRSGPLDELFSLIASLPSNTPLFNAQKNQSASDRIISGNVLPACFPKVRVAHRIGNSSLETVNFKKLIDEVN